MRIIYSQQHFHLMKIIWIVTTFWLKKFCAGNIYIYWELCNAVAQRCQPRTDDICKTMLGIL